MFFDALQSYYTPVVTLLIFTVMIMADKLFSKRIKRLLLWESGVIFLMISTTWTDQCLSTVVLNGLAWKLRTVTAWINFAISPFSPMILALIYETEGSKRFPKLFFLPVVLNIFLCMVSIWSGWVFHINSENIYARGPLFIVPFAVSAFYLFYLIFCSAKQKDKPNRKAETALLTVIMGAIGLAVVMEIFLALRFMVWSVSEVSFILYLLLLTTQKILYDPLTGTFSRIAYEKRLEKINCRTVCTVAMIDLNHLKKVNDRFGHSVGDAAICGAATAILKVKLRHMQLYRYGGDEFVLLSSRLCGDEMKKVLQEAQEYCEMVHGVSLSFAYGVAEYHPGDDLHKVILNADANMYRCKMEMRDASRRERNHSI